MNKKVLMFFALMGLLAVVCVSAVDVNSTDLSNGTENITLDGVNFTIPEGFSENATLRTVNDTEEALFIHYTVNSRVYENDTVSFSVLVADYGPNNVTSDVVSSIGGNKTTINGVDGYSGMSNGCPTFNFVKDHKLATIASNDPDVFSKIVA